jgi:hypothetical protein
MNVEPDSTCQRKPAPCASQAEQRELHGKPMDFERAVWRCWSDGFCTTEEAEAAIARYKLAWARGSCA